MRTLKTIYLTLWFRCHVSIGGLGGNPDVYPTWEQAWTLARGLA
jgi:hypothetical protein